MMHSANAKIKAARIDLMFLLLYDNFTTQLNCGKLCLITKLEK